MRHVACLGHLWLGVSNGACLLDRQDCVAEHRTIIFPGHNQLSEPLSQFYTLHQYLFHKTTVQRQRQLKKEILTAKQELLQTSAQDQFAKWAKLRRKVDKGLEDLEKLSV